MPASASRGYRMLFHLGLPSTTVMTKKVPVAPLGQLCQAFVSLAGAPSSKLSMTQTRQRCASRDVA